MVHCPQVSTTVPINHHQFTHSVRFLGHGFGAGYALAIVIGSIRAEREDPHLKTDLTRTFRRQAMMIFLVFIYRCAVSFASTNDLTRPNNDPLATISKAFFYFTQLPLELAICWNHASTDYRTVVDAGPRGDLPRKALENGKKARKWPTTFLKDVIVSKMLPFRGQRQLPLSGSASVIIPLTRMETPIQSQTTTIVSTKDGDIEKQSILSIPSTSPWSSTLRSTATRPPSTYLIDMEKEQQLEVPSSSLVEDVEVWTPRRSIWDF